MTTPYEVRGDELINELKERLKKLKEIELPERFEYVKTSSGKERPPEQEDWWFIRSASILRKIYLKGPLGVSKLRREYSTRKNRGHQPEKTYKAGGAIIRNILQELEEAELIKKSEKGRKITPKGQSFLDNLSNELIQK